MGIKRVVGGAVKGGGGVRWSGSHSRGSGGMRHVQQLEPGGVDAQPTVQDRGLTLLMNV